MDMQKVFEVFNENEKRKFWGAIEVEFKGGVPNCITKTQKILFDPYQPKAAQEGAAEGEKPKVARNQ